MSVHLPARLSRLAALALLGAVLLGVYGLAVYPHIHAYPQARADLAEARERLERFRRVAAAAAAVEQEMAAARSAQRMSGAFLDGSSNALAAAAMQNRLDEAVQAAGGAVRSVRSLPAEGEDGLVRLRLRMQLSTTIHGLKRLLYGVETGRPLLFVDALDLRGRLARTSQDSDRLEMSEEMQVDLTVAGYRLAEGPS